MGAPPAAAAMGVAAVGGAAVATSAAASPRSPVAGVAGLNMICTTEQGKGLSISARVMRQGGQVGGY